MAKEKKETKKKESKETVDERSYNIPLRREFMKVQRYKRAKKAVNAVKKFLSRHMKSETIKVGKNLNKKIWERGIKNPPHHVKVTARKDKEGVVFAELFGIPAEKDEKKDAKKKPGKLTETAGEKPKELAEATQKELAAGQKAEELEKEIEKEATMDPEKKESEEDIRKALNALKGKK